MSKLNNVVELAGRILISVLFMTAGIGKIGAYAATQGYMASMGVPAQLLPVVIVTEILGSTAIILGFHTRLTAFLLAGFTLIAALIFHTKFGDPVQQIMFLKDVSITGAFALLFVHGAGAWSLDTLVLNRTRSKQS